MPHDAAHSSLTAELSAEPIPVESRATCHAPLRARDRLAQLAARERRGELIVLGQLRHNGHEQLVGQIKQLNRQIGRLILGYPADVAKVVHGPVGCRLSCSD
jgi:hypothetical protein